MLALFWSGATLQAHALSASEFYEQVSPSVWKVVTYDGDGLALAKGSAVVIGDETLITNCHVLRKAKDVVVRQGNTMHGAMLEYLDIERDLCELKVKDLHARPVPVAGSKEVKVGDPVFTLGNPKGLELTLGSGLVSALRKDQDDHIRWIQTSAPVSAGSSGGGLFDAKGRLIGITSMIVPGVDAQNLSFALPAEWIAAVPERSAAALKAEQEHGAPSASPVPVAQFQERQVTGQALAEHFAALRSVQAKTSLDPSVTFSILSTDSLQLTSNSNPMTSSWSNFRVNLADSTFCIDMPQLNQTMTVNRLNPLRGCYRLYLTGQHQYTLRSVQEDNYFIQYSL